MITITKEMRTETGHRLMDYDGRCAHLHGHSYLWRVTAAARGVPDVLDPRGMVVDFKDLKRAMKVVLDPLDHCMLVRRDDPLAVALSTIPATNNEHPRVWLTPFNPTAEELARWAAIEIEEHLSGLVGTHRCSITRVEVWETATSFAVWERKQ